MKSKSRLRPVEPKGNTDCPDKDDDDDIDEEEDVDIEDFDAVTALVNFSEMVNNDKNLVVDIEIKMAKPSV